ncbi:hypothetical protein [Butyrivibrio sp. LC3010]|uniref:hypothetical protein n=1 Tax=Butyrivibrio sp. LC3010 TaxID=1280680 RepID=UPI00040B8E15|nr:hypothetical protein [Butyrivibrio sp. LC3010]
MGIAGVTSNSIVLDFSNVINKLEAKAAADGGNLLWISGVTYSYVHQTADATTAIRQARKKALKMGRSYNNFNNNMTTYTIGGLSPSTTYAFSCLFSYSYHLPNGNGVSGMEYVELGNIPTAPKDMPAPTPAPNPTPTPAPNPTPAPAPTPTPAPAPNPTPAPKPNPTPAPAPNPTPAPKPNPTPAPKPNPTPAPKPNPTPAPKPNPTPAPKPNPTPAPKPNPTPAPKPNPTPAPKPNPAPAPKSNQETQKPQEAAKVNDTAPSDNNSSIMVLDQKNTLVAVDKDQLKASKLKKKKQSITMKVTKDKGKIKVKNASSKKLRKYAKIKINNSKRKIKITFKKGAPKGKYKFNVAVGSKKKGTKSTETFEVVVK